MGMTYPALISSPCSTPAVVGGRGRSGGSRGGGPTGGRGHAGGSGRTGRRRSLLDLAAPREQTAQPDTDARRRPGDAGELQELAATDSLAARGLTVRSDATAYTFVWHVPSSRCSRLHRSPAPVLAVARASGPRPLSPRGGHAGAPGPRHPVSHRERSGGWRSSRPGPAVAVTLVALRASTMEFLSIGSSVRRGTSVHKSKQPMKLTGWIHCRPVSASPSGEYAAVGDRGRFEPLRTSCRVGWYSVK